MIFCKAPVPGQVKTRLLTELSAVDAAEIHKELSLRTIRLATQNCLCAVQLWCAPSTEHPFFVSLAAIYPILLRQQQGVELGEKMQNAFCSAFNQYSRALLVGCDCPSLTAHDLDYALTALESPASCVLAPAEDGGYVLIGLNQLHPELFSGMPWGTEHVFELTRARVDQLHLGYFELSQQWDLDRSSDLIRYLSSR